MATQHNPAFEANPALLAAGAVRQATRRRETPEAAPKRDRESMLTHLRVCAATEAASWTQHDGAKPEHEFANKREAARERIERAYKEPRGLSAAKEQSETLPDVEAFVGSAMLVRQCLREVERGMRKWKELPQVQRGEAGAAPRVYHAAASYMRSVGYDFDEGSFAVFFTVLQENVALEMAELWTLRPFAELALLEKIANEAQALRADEKPGVSAEGGFASLIASLRRVEDADWKALFERVNATEHILAQDPAGAYSRMDFESRDSYRKAVAEIAKGSARSEQEIAKMAVALAGAPQECGSERARMRRSHVGYYLVDGGRAALERGSGYRRSASESAMAFVKRWPDFSYILSIEILTLAIMAAPALKAHASFLSLLVLGLFLFPAADCAVSLINQLVTALFPPKALPKLDFSKGVPAECSGIVVVPTLLTSEAQMARAVRDLEIRFLANRDGNVHFALLTDPPDSKLEFDEKDKLAERCARLIEELNRKYAPENKGSFFLFHRHRTYNAAEGIWMGWERKRGKLLDFNNLLLKQSDCFPIKAGNLFLLRSIQYVITLDLDTQLPRDTARKLIGALAHPLNQAVIDPQTNTVVEGYGILQPRVDISIQSANRSRLAAIFSGDTGVDVYTRAVSDVYQDLFGEGSFTGKGIYEVRTFQQVLEHRFPCNAILSHDMIEGAYARAGLVSDIEVVDDYPTHISAYSRRKHRWVRGDWQVIFWILPRVPNFFGKMVGNPLSTISRWKIIDNLRRSLTEIATLAMLLTAWIFLPGKALYWTLATLTVFALPTFTPFVISLMRAGRALFTSSFWEAWGEDVGIALANLFMRITCLCHQSLVTLDAVARAIVRMAVTHEGLLEWETSAEAESAGGKRTPIEAYLELTVWLSFFIGLFLALARPGSFMVALPFLVLWGLSKPICQWLNLPSRSGETNLLAEEKTLLRHSALRTWRMFREFSTAEENWLIPDTVQEPATLIVHRISTTNLGLLLNARLAATDLGFFTWPELIADTERTLDSVERMPKLNGQMFNWYDTRTLEAVHPRFVSAVDNGNLVCSLWTLKQACLEAVNAPIFRQELWKSALDFVQIIEELLDAREREGALGMELEALKERITSLGTTIKDWAAALPEMELAAASLEKKVPRTHEAFWWAHELSVRIAHLQRLVFDFAPWLLPQFGALSQDTRTAEAIRNQNLTIGALPRVCARLEKELDAILEPEDQSVELSAAGQMLRSAVKRSTSIAEAAVKKLEELATRADSIAKAMDFTFLYDAKKKLLATGFNAEENRMTPSHYDLLASEARATAFAAIAKGDIPQESWFAMDRPYTRYKNETVLLSWTGTMFEYLMPLLWMKTCPNTTLDVTTQAAVRCQRKYAEEKSIPWGISEASCSKLAPDGHYHYEAFGVPGLAVSRELSRDLVVSPYSTFLSLSADAKAAIENLALMKSMGFSGTYGFYESIDFTPSRLKPGSQFEIVRCWLAHHQGMSLVSVANLLCNGSAQRRFHAEPMVAATERLLHEKVSVDSVELPAQEAATEVAPSHESEAKAAAPANPWEVDDRLHTAA